jgi:Photosynthetic reaction centre cytochrome C subunit
MRRTLPILLLAIPLLLLAAAPQDPQKKGNRPPPKNLKVLKPEDVGPVMGAMRPALGVQCTFCHMPPDMASDDNPKKLIARHMMEMVNQINANFPDGKVHVSCYTCHRGATMPLMTPPPAGGGL